MKNQRYVFKDKFAVIGKAGQGPADNLEWIGSLWEDANAHFHEIADLALKNENGIPFIWGAMNDASENNKRWSDNVGRYMAAAEVSLSVQAPEGWKKQIIPAQTYLAVSCTMEEYPDIFNQISNDPEIKIVGTVHEFYPEPGNPSVLELYFPIAEGKLET